VISRLQSRGLLVRRSFKNGFVLSVVAVITAGCSGSLTHRPATRILSGGTVRLTVVYGGYAVRAYTRVTINGRTYFFAVDTGAARTVVTSQTASALGLPKHGATFRARSIGCAGSAQPVLISHWRLGGIPLPPTAVAESNIHLYGAKVDGQPVAGLLGSDVLRQFGRATFQFHQQRLILGQTAPMRGKAVKFIALDPATGGYEEVIKVKINGRPVRLFVDTGAELTYIDAPSARLLRLQRLGWSGRIKSVYGCTVPAHSVAIKQWTMGHLTIPATYAVAAPLAFKYKGVIVQGLLGPDVLSTYRQVTFDFTNRRLVILGPPKYFAIDRDK
jgi:predicted aspartyl protease